MPAELSDEELDAIVAAAIAESGAASPKDMGQVMKVVMAKTAADLVAAGRDAQSAAEAAVQLLSRRTNGTGTCDFRR